MSETAYALVLPCREQADGDARRFEHVVREHGLSPRPLGYSALLAVTGSAAVVPGGAVIGRVYPQGSAPHTEPVAIAVRLAVGDVAATDRFWGDFVTVTAPPGRPSWSVARSAFGSLPCFWTDTGSHVLVASSPTLIEALSGRPAIDWQALAVYLAAPELRGPRTCLEGLHELPGGSELSLDSGKVIVRARWSPWQVIGGRCPVDDPAEAAHVVGDAVDRAVAARCREATGRVLLLSGGLDSSTVAAALAQADLDFASLTMVTRQKIGDEREYARAVAEALGSPLTEVMRSTAALDWADPTPRRLARPSARIFRQPSLAAAHRLAADLGADMIVDGGGGDNVFCSLQSAAPLLDRVAIEGYGRGAWETARETALRAKVGMTTVFVSAARRKLQGRTAFRWPTDTGFLSKAARDLKVEATRLEWLQPPSGTLPGEAAHVALVAGAISLAEDDSTRTGARTISPLVSQPVVEAALRVRSWLWFERGRNRAVIRRALAGRLPATILARTGKGTPAGFMGEVVEDHRDRLRELLLDGLLVANCVADRSEIEAELSTTVLHPDNRFSRLLVIADAERWARLWSADPI